MSYSCSFYYQLIKYLLVVLILKQLISIKKEKEDATKTKTKTIIRKTIVTPLESPAGTLNNLNFYNFLNIQGKEVVSFQENIFYNNTSPTDVSPDPTNSTLLYQVPPGKKAIFGHMTLSNTVQTQNLNVGIILIDVFDSSNTFLYRSIFKPGPSTVSDSSFPYFLVKEEQIVRIKFANSLVTPTNPSLLQINALLRGFEFDASIPLDIQITFIPNGTGAGLIGNFLSYPADTTTTIRRYIPPYFGSATHAAFYLQFCPFSQITTFLNFRMLFSKQDHVNPVNFGTLNTSVTSSTFFSSNSIQTFNLQLSFETLGANNDFYGIFIYFDEPIEN